MSVGRQFKRIGHIGVALALWRGVFWIFGKPKRILIIGVSFFLIIGVLVNLTSDINKKFYVNANQLPLLDKPFGKTVKTLEMNDSLIYLKKMGDDWAMVLVDQDTLYFENKYDFMQSFGKIEKSPFDIEKALKGEKVKLNHPDGYFDAKPRMLRNGDEITVISYSNSTKEIRFKVETSSFLYLPIEYLIIDWEVIKKRYPKLEIHPEEM
jgi:hypothetical protein